MQQRMVSVRRLTALAAVAVLGAACGVANNQTSNGPTDTTPVTIGLVTGFGGATNTNAALGQAQVDGANLAIKVLGGKAGSHPISVVARDDQINTSLTTQQANDLVQTQHVNFLTGCVSAATTIPLNTVAKNAGIPYLGTCQTELLNRSPNYGPFTFHIAPLPSQDVNILAPWLVNNLGKNIAILAPDYAWGHEQDDAYAKAIPAAGGNIVTTVWAPLATLDFTTIIPKLQAAKPDVVLVGFPGHGEENFVKQAKLAGLDKQAKIFLYLSDQAWDEEMGFDAEAGTYSMTNFTWTGKDSGTQKFVKAYEKEYGKPPGGYAAYSYNAIMLIADAVTKNSYQPDTFAKFLAGAKIDLAEGPMTIRACDHQSYQPSYILHGLAQADAASKGGSAQYGYRELLTTLPAPSPVDANTAPACSTLGISS